MKKLLAVLLVLAMVLSLAACGKKDEPKAAEPAPAAEPAKEEPAPAAEEPAPAEEPAAEEAAPAEEPAAEEAAPAEEPAAAEEPAPEEDGALKLYGPFISTTCGQSPGAIMFTSLAKTVGIESVNDNALTADKLMETAPAGVKTVVITTGTSGKGMGAAGTDVDDEIARCTAIAEEAKKQGLTVVCAHIEGMARRTDYADQASIDAIIAIADIVVCTDDGDGDGLFTNYCAEHGIPMIKVTDAKAITSVLG